LTIVSKNFAEASDGARTDTEIPFPERERGFPRLFGINMIINSLLCLGLWYYRHRALVVVASVEVHNAVNKRVEGVILAYAYVLARVVPCAALAHNDVAGYALLAAPDLDA